MIDFNSKHLVDLFPPRKKHYIGLVSPFFSRKIKLVSSFGKFFYIKESRDLQLYNFSFSDNIEDLLCFDSYDSCFNFIFFELKKIKENKSLLVDKNSVLEIFKILTEEDIMIKDIIE